MKTLKILILIITILAASLLLGSCGGGGGGSSSGSAPAVTEPETPQTPSGTDSYLLADEVMESSAETSVVPEWAENYYTPDDIMEPETEEERLYRLTETVNEIFDSRADDVYVPLIIKVKTDYLPEGFLNRDNKISQRQQIRSAQDGLVASLIAKTSAGGKASAFAGKTVSSFSTVPAVVMQVTKEEAMQVVAETGVDNIYEDLAVAPDMAESNPLIGSPTAWNAGFSGSGQTVAVLDTGVSKTHTFLSGRVVSEACYSKAGGAGSGTSLCPGGVVSSTAAGSGVDCSATLSACSHGTHVAGTIAGYNASFSGVAKDATLIAIQVFTNINGQVLSYTSDQIKALERVYALRNTYNIASVNMSLGGSRYYSPCDSDATKPIIDNLRSVGIATVIASGNNGYGDSVSSPGCISSAVTVGSVGDGSSGSVADAVSSFSNSDEMIDLLAPGQYIYSSVPGGSYAIKQGTSMATPHVAGAFAVMKSVKPTAGVDEIESALKGTGKSVTDSKNSLAKPRIRLDQAIYSMGVGSVRIDINPANAVNDGAQWKLNNGAWQNSGTVLSNIPVGVYTVTFKSITNSNNDKRWVSPDKITVTVASDGDSVTDTAAYTEADKTYAKKDTDGDGKSDMVFLNTSTGQMIVWKMNQNTIETNAAVINTANQQVSIGLSTYAAAGTGDFDGDGKTDILFRHKTNGSFQIWFMDGRTRLSVQNVKNAGGTLLQPSVSAYSFAGTGDMNGDGKSDIIIRNKADGSFIVWLMDGVTQQSSAFVKNNAGTIIKYPVATWPVYGFADSDGDGKTDIFLRNVSDNSTNIWRMNGTVAASINKVKRTNATVLAPSKAVWNITGAGDMNGDGKADILIRSKVTGEMYAYFIDGATMTGGVGIKASGATTNLKLALAWVFSAIQDIDGDGTQDLVFRNSSDNSFYGIILDGGVIESKDYLKKADGTVLKYVSAWATGF